LPPCEAPPLEAVIEAWPLVSRWRGRRFNPNGAMPFRLTGELIRETLPMSDEDIAVAQQSLGQEMPDRLSISMWNGGRNDRDLS
jgi:hypothetical protein